MFRFTKAQRRKPLPIYTVYIIQPIITRRKRGLEEIKFIPKHILYHCVKEGVNFTRDFGVAVFHVLLVVVSGVYCRLLVWLSMLSLLPFCNRCRFWRLHLSLLTLYLVLQVQKRNFKIKLVIKSNYMLENLIWTS